MDGKSQETAVETTTATKDEKSLGQKIKEVFTGKKDEATAEDIVTAEEKIDDPEDKSAVSNSNADLQTTIEQAKQEAVAEYKKQLEEQERKSKLSPEELKAEEDAEKDKELERLRHDILVRDCRDKAITELNNAGFPVELADIIDYTSEETAKESLSKIKKVYADSIEKGIKERLKGRTPTGLNANNDINSTADMQAKIYKQMGIKTKEDKK